MRDWSYLPIEPSEWPEGEGDPKKPDSVECPTCNGSGFTVHLWPIGHVELCCRQCDGEGMVGND